MSGDFSELTPDKPVKRVRFSLDIADVYEYDPEENSGNFPLESESNTIPSELHNVEQNELVVEDSSNKETNILNVTDAANFNKCTSEFCDDTIYELVDCNPPLAVTDHTYKPESSSSYAHSDSPPTDCFNNNNSDLSDLHLIISQTNNMTISSPEEVQELGKCSSSDPNSEEKKTFEKQKTNVVTRKRSSGGMLIERQTTKLNRYLENDNINMDSAIDVKNAVFNAWIKVKNLSAKAENSSNILEVSEKTARPPQPCDIKSENSKNVRLKSAKRSARKISSSRSEKTCQKKKDDEESKMHMKKDDEEDKMQMKKDDEEGKMQLKKDDEESKMAFRAWKKKKDELLNQQIAEKHKKEEKQRLDTLMNERMRKSDAESAYLAWSSHKATVVKIEKKKSRWLLKKEKEKLTEKIKRNDEAAKIYYKWLRNKVFSKQIINNYHQTEDKPPWTPPGKANSII